MKTTKIPFSPMDAVKMKVLIPCVVTLEEVQFSSVAQLCPTLCDPMNRSTPGLPAHHHLPELTQTHVHRVRDAGGPLLLLPPIPPSIRVFPVSWLFASGGQSIAPSSSSTSVLPMNIQG